MGEALRFAPADIFPGGLLTENDERFRVSDENRSLSSLFSNSLHSSSSNIQPILSI